MNQTNFRRISNRADWSETIELIDDDTGEVITDLDDVIVRVQVREGCRPVLTAETGDETVVVSSFGTITWTFPASRLSNICPGTYEVGITIERNGSVEQELIGSLPVYEGVARA